MMLLSDIIKSIEDFAPKYIKEDFDNVGLMVGDKKRGISKILLALDCTNEVIEEIDNEKEEDWQQKFIYIFEYVIKNKEFIKNIYNSGSKEYFLKFVYKQTNLLIINFIEKEYKNKKVKEENKKFIANFYKYGFVGIMEEWIETGMKKNPKEIVSKLNDIIEGDIERALEKLSKEK